MSLVRQVEVVCGIWQPKRRFQSIPAYACASNSDNASALTSKLYAEARWRAEGADRLERAVERIEAVNWQSSGSAEAIVMRLSSK